MIRQPDFSNLLPVHLLEIHLSIFQLQTKVQKLGTDLTEEREMNKCLTKNQSQWQKKVADMERRLEEKDKVSVLI